MSLIRLSRPGQPPVLIDQGPSVGRRTASRMGIRGGGNPIVVGGAFPVGESTRARDLRLQREAMERSRKP